MDRVKVAFQSAPGVMVWSILSMIRVEFVVSWGFTPPFKLSETGSTHTDAE